jgi:hypothetical protein
MIIANVFILTSKIYTTIPSFYFAPRLKIIQLGKAIHPHKMARDNKKFNKTKEIIKFILDYKCFFCSKQSLNNHLHHLDNDNTNNDPFNFVCLCEEHHRLVHRLRMKIQPILCSSQIALLKAVQKLT